jgi:hypothetical protein
MTNVKVSAVFKGRHYSGMIPFEFDHAVLESLPWPREEDVKRVISILRALVLRRVIQYWGYVKSLGK